MNGDVIVKESVSDEMEANIDVFGSLEVGWVFCNVESALIV